jgi:uncharacterized protein
MTTRLVDALGARVIGTVERVTPDSFTVAINAEAPHATALNTGTPERFPRINGYLIVPHSGGATVGIVSSVRIDRSSFPKQHGPKDSDLVDLPFPQRFAVVTPLGTLQRRYEPGGEHNLVMERGVDIFPSVGDAAHLPGRDQLAAIVGSTDQAAVPIGRSPLADGLEIRVDPDRLFGRHLAVLGNTGSGKSCSVAGLIRWSIEAAVHEARTWRGRVVVLDPNGEYGNAFADLAADVRVYKVTPSDGAQQLRVPAWLWNADEWASFTRAAPGVQRPILVDALQRARGTGTGSHEIRHQIGNTLLSAFGFLLDAIRTENFRQKNGAFPPMLRGFATDLEHALASFQGPGDVNQAITGLTEEFARTEESLRSGSQSNGGYWYHGTNYTVVGELKDKCAAVLELLGPRSLRRVDEHAPVPMDVRLLKDLIDLAARTSNIRNADQMAASLSLRVETILTQERFKVVALPSEEPTLAEWLEEYLAPTAGAATEAAGSIVVLDLSLLPPEITHTVVSVTCRVIFEALQRHRRLFSQVLPTCLVIEEAHIFAHARMATDTASAPAQQCSETIAKIAREGRKFGLGMVLSSQRPSELSPTVLSQCNTFLLHRIVNDRDQDQVRRLVPDGLGDVLRELPSLPTRRAVLLGWAMPAPVVVEMRCLDAPHRPQSSDPDFWSAWTEADPRVVDWPKVAEDWVTGSVIGRDVGTDNEEPEDDAGS